ncbi:MAG: hypothetical protein ACFFCO_06825 [Promethearchaeota archaeon]
MSLFGRLLGFKDPSPNVLRIAAVVLTIGSVWSIAFQISTTFWMIYIAEALGGGDILLGLGLVGILVMVRLAIQTLLDFPTGGIGDWLGQRWIVASALVCYSLSFWLTSTVTPTTPFPVFLLIYILMGLGASQESGAVEAWFDNNYRVAMPHDQDRKQFGVFSARRGMLFQLVSTIILIPGSFIALLYSRALIFQVQAVLFIGLAIMSLLFIRDLPGARQEPKKRPSLREYGGLLKDGLKFVGSSRFVTFTFIGQMFMWAVGITWWNILLFPFYFGYLLSDIAVATFRTTMFAPMVVAAERSGTWSKRFDPVKWIPRFNLIYFGSLGFFFGLVLITLVFPSYIAAAPFITLYLPFTAFPILTLPLSSVVPIFLIYILFVLTDALGRITEILNQRVMIDVFPNRIRNCMYSLRPTVAMLFALPVIFTISQLIPVFGFPLIFSICGFLALIGALLIRKGFSYPIPKDRTILEEISRDKEAVEATHQPHEDIPTTPPEPIEVPANGLEPTETPEEKIEETTGKP